MRSSSCFSQQGSQTDPAGGALSPVFPSLADETSSRQRFDDDGNTTGPGLLPVGYSLHALHFLTLFKMERLTRRPCTDGRAPVSRAERVFEKREPFRIKVNPSVPRD